MTIYPASIAAVARVLAESVWGLLARHATRTAEAAGAGKQHRAEGAALEARKRCWTSSPPEATERPAPKGHAHGA